METILFSILHSYRTKIIGVVCAIISFILLIIHHLITPLILVPEVSFSQAANHFHLALLFSLDIIMSSKEKIEDERISIIRGRAFMLASQIFMSTLLIGLMISVFSRPITDFVSGVITYSYIYLVGYLLIFHAGIYLDSPTADDDLEASIKKRPQFYRYYTVFIIALIIAVFLFVYL